MRGGVLSVPTLSGKIPLNTSLYDSLSFWVNGGMNGGQVLQIQALLNGSAPKTRVLSALPPNTWRQFTIPLTQLGADNQPDLDRINFQLTAGGSANPFFVDDIEFTAKPGPALVHLSIKATQSVPAGRRAVVRRQHGRVGSLPGPVALRIAVAGFQPHAMAPALSYGIPQDQAAQSSIGSPDLAPATFTIVSSALDGVFPPYSATLLFLQAEAPKLSVLLSPKGRRSHLGIENPDCYLAHAKRDDHPTKEKCADRAADDQTANRRRSAAVPDDTDQAEDKRCRCRGDDGQPAKGINRRSSPGLQKEHAGNSRRCGQRQGQAYSAQDSGRRDGIQHKICGLQLNSDTLAGCG